MGEVIAFARRAAVPAEDDIVEIDLVTAVDVAIRDLRDIEDHLPAEAARARASECRRLLSDALRRALV